MPTTPPVEEEDEWGITFFFFSIFFLKILSLTHYLVAEKMWERRGKFLYFGFSGFMSTCLDVIIQLCYCVMSVVFHLKIVGFTMLFFLLH